MNKYIFKQCLNAIDRLEIQGLSPLELKNALFERLQDKTPNFTFFDISELVDMLLSQNMLMQFNHITDLSVPLTIFARAPHNSVSEALAFFESMFQDTVSYDSFMKRIDSSYTKQEVIDLFKSIPSIEEVIFEIPIFDKIENRYFVKSALKPLLCKYGLKSDDRYLVSSITLAYFIHDVTQLHNIPFRNQNHLVVSYPHEDIINQVVPYRGIPEKREASENLQSFFKDCLFHEFQHQCAICSISIPQMLIASHIKPFRDCGHVIEAADYNNGILLCKNHDFLFDQGYISFRPNGKIMISDQIATKDFIKFQLHPDFYLKEKLMTPMRQQFLTYHKNNYFKIK